MITSTISQLLSLLQVNLTCLLLIARRHVRRAISFFALFYLKILLFEHHFFQFFLKFSLNGLTGFFGERVKLEHLQEVFLSKNFNLLCDLTIFNSNITQCK